MDTSGVGGLLAENTIIKTSIEVQAAGPPHNEKENREIRDPDACPSSKQTKMKRHSWRTQTTAVVMLSAPSVLHLVSPMSCQCGLTAYVGYSLVFKFNAPDPVRRLSL